MLGSNPLFVSLVGVTVPAVLFLLCLVVSAAFTAAEAALSTAPSYYRRELGLAAPEPERGLAPPREAFVSMLVGKQLANVAAGGLAVALAIAVLPLTLPWAVLAGVVTAGLVLLTIGEVLPRALASRDPRSGGPTLTGWIRTTHTMLGPLARSIERISTFGGAPEPSPGRVFLDDREIKRVVEAGEEQGVLAEEEQEMIEAVIDFGEDQVGDVMAPRTDVVAVEASTSVEELAEVVTESGYSRIPIYREDLDNVVGIVHSKDVLDALREDPKQPVDAIMKETLFVPETAPLDEVLRDMKTRRTHLAIVHDEFGGTAGLVTLEDLLEEIVGDIFDEYDPEAEQIERVDEDEVLVDARMDIDRFNEELGVRLDTHQGYETLGGFLFHKLGRPGREGETVEHGGLAFTLEDVANRRILRVRVQLDTERGDDADG